jgi:cytosine deaminase
MSPHQLVIRNARLRHDQGAHSIGIDNGTITAITADTVDGDEVIDADHNLVCESFVNGHMHLCKAYTFDKTNAAALNEYAGGSMGGAMTSIELASAVKKNYTDDAVYERAKRAALEGIRNGVTHVQAFADTDTAASLHGVNGVMRVRDELRDVMEISVVAFPQDGLLRDPGAEELVADAMARGADTVGGIPWIEFTDAEAGEHIDRMLDLAVKHNARVAMLVDDAGDASLRTLERLAIAAAERGLHGRVTACHARAAGSYPEPTFRRLAALLKRSQIGVVSDPHTGPLHVRPFDLYDLGVDVGLGQDDIEDAYYPLGRHNMLEVAFLAAHLLGDLSPRRLETVLDMVTVSAARALGIHNHQLTEGNPANLVVLDGQSTVEVLSRHSAPRVVISKGRIVARNLSSSELSLQ